jgi:hypothetical protein
MLQLNKLVSIFTRLILHADAMKRITFSLLMSLFTVSLIAQPFEWGSAFGGQQNDIAQRIAVGQNGLVYTAGNFSGSMEIASTSVAGYGFQDVFVACYNDAGELIWVSAVGGNGTDQISAICADNSGDIWISGRFTGKIDVDPGSDSTIITSQPANGLDGFLIKLSGLDGSLLAYRDITSGGVLDIRTIRSDAETDDLFIGGQYSGTCDFDFGSGSQLRSSNSNSGDAFIGRYTGDFVYNWVNTFGSSNASIDFVSALDFDSQDGLYCTGMIGGTADIDPGFGTTNLTCFIDAFLIKYNRNNGQLTWGFNLGGSSLESGNAIIISDQDEIVISGTMNSASFDADPSFGIVTVNSGGLTAVPFIARYESTGQTNSAYVVQGASGLVASITSLQFTLDSYLVLGGYFTGNINFTIPSGSTTSFNSGASSDAFIATFTVDNRLQDIITITGDGNQQASDFRLDGQLTYVCGQLDNTTFPEVGSTSPIIPANTTAEAFLFRYNENPTQVESMHAANSTMFVFPNPAGNSIQLSDFAEHRVEIFDATGRSMGLFSGKTFDISALPCGVYVLAVLDNPNSDKILFVKSH